MNLLQQLAKKKLDLSPLGLGRGESRSDYFCTPKGAKILGWEGTDGIHYCQIKSLGEMVFSVNPMGAQGSHVHPLAENERDFLKLLLACGHTAALEQIHDWSREEFERFLRENPPAPFQQALLLRLEKEFALTPAADPFSAVKTLQAGFDYSRIPYQRDYYEWVPPPRKQPDWKVYYQGGFFGKGSPYSRPGVTLPVNRQIPWGGNQLHIPALYPCGKGLVVDLCMEISPSRERNFLEKYCPALSAGAIPPEEQEQMELENPMDLHFRLTARLNGKSLRQSSGCSLLWVPPDCLPGELGEAPDSEAEWVLTHYRLDPSRCWSLWRISLPWAASRRPQIRSLALTLWEEPGPVPGIRFRVENPGDRVEFIHPLTGQSHTLIVTEYAFQTVPFDLSPEREYPTHYAALGYQLEPPIPAAGFSLRDCCGGDRPRRKNPPDSSRFEPEAQDDAAVGIIGGADGPVALFLSGGASGTGSGESQTRFAASSLYFDPIRWIDWRMVFYTEEKEAFTLTVIP